MNNNKKIMILSGERKRTEHIMLVIVLITIAFIMSSDKSRVLGHSTVYDDVQPWNPAKPGYLPPIRSYHVHVLFNPIHNSDDCTGYDQAMLLRNEFITRFNMPEQDCAGDFHQGHMCMFTTALTAFGPFPQAQWAAFIPLEHYLEVSTWIIQHRGPFDIFIHPNTGFERQDHRDWGLWGGQIHHLNLSADEFSEVLYPNGEDPVYNCRTVDKVFDMPDKIRHNEPKPGKAHIRYFNALPTMGPNVEFTPMLDGKVNGERSAALTPLGHNWYDDIVSTRTGKHVINTSLSYNFPMPLSPKPDEFYTMILLLAENRRDVMSKFYLDDNEVRKDGWTKIRIINLMEGLECMRYSIDYNALNNRCYKYLDAEWNLVHGTQLLLTFKDESGNILEEINVFVNEGSTYTAYLKWKPLSSEVSDGSTRSGNIILSSSSGSSSAPHVVGNGFPAELILIKDFPQDCPPDPK